MFGKKQQSRGAGGFFDIESPMAIELRRIMIRIGRKLDLERKRAIMVTSAERGEGKSLFSLHFALVLAYHLQRKIVLVDADIRRPVQHTVFQAKQSPGFAEMLAGEATAKEAVQETKVKNLGFLPAGLSGGNPSRLFSRASLRRTIDDLHSEHDLLLLDSPPVVPVSDPLHYLDAMDGTLFLVMAGQTPRELSQRGVEILNSAGANMLGLVANNLAEVLPYYYDNKYYGYDKSK